MPIGVRTPCRTQPSKVSISVSKSERPRVKPFFIAITILFRGARATYGNLAAESGGSFLTRASEEVKDE